MDKAKIKILVVDDEQGLCAGVQEALQREGYVVEATTDAPAALKLTQERLYNLVISDIKMPGLSGLELLTRVRERSRDTLFILMTAYGTVESAVEAGAGSHFPNNGKAYGDYPPAGGQRNSFFGDIDVAQIGNLLYRGLAIRRASETSNGRRLPVGVTAD